MPTMHAYRATHTARVEGPGNARLWLSPSVAPHGCGNAMLGNGRVLWPSTAGRMVSRLEPET